MDRQTEVTIKLDRLRTWLGQVAQDAILLSSQANFAWITAGGHSHIAIGEAGGIASVLVTRQRAYVLTTNIERQRLLDEELGGTSFETIAYPWHEPAQLGAVLHRLANPARTVSDSGAGDVPLAEPTFAALRYTLQLPEVERYRQLGRAAAEAVERACRDTRPGESELQVAARVACACARRDILPLVNLVAADERIARYRHPLPTPNPVRRTLLVALTGRRHGLHASLTRMVSFGPPDADLVARHQAVIQVDARLILASRPGVRLNEAFAGGVAQYATAGFPGEWRRHHQGGLTGYSGREVFATPMAEHRLDAGQVVAWNPSITRVKSEDTALVTEDGPEILTRTGDWPEQEVRSLLGNVNRPLILEQAES